jgi:protein involved in polysaccharide export with SLBB domain
MPTYNSLKDRSQNSDKQGPIERYVALLGSGHSVGSTSNTICPIRSKSEHDDTETAEPPQSKIDGILIDVNPEIVSVGDQKQPRFGKFPGVRKWIAFGALYTAIGASVSIAGFSILHGGRDTKPTTTRVQSDISSRTDAVAIPGPTADRSEAVMEVQKSQKQVTNADSSQAHKPSRPTEPAVPGTLQRLAVGVREPGSAVQQSAAPATAPRDLAYEPTPSVAQSPSATPKGIAVGDRVKIRIYQETVAGNGQQLSLSSLIEHSEITGEYVVQLDGTIYLPFVGKVQAAGETERQAQQRLEQEASKTLNSPIKATIQITQREPVYVTGAVPHPGIFPYTPGMTVLHAIILAGAGTPSEHVQQQLDVIRELEHLRRSDTELADLLARRDVLVAQRDSNKAVVSQGLIDLLGASGAMERIAAAAKVTDLETAEVKAGHAGLDESITVLEQRRIILLEGLKAVEARLVHNAERVKSASQFRKNGVMTDESYYRAHSELAASQLQWNQFRENITRAEERLFEVRQQRKKLAADAEISREREIAKLNTSIAQAMDTRTLLRPVLTQSSVGDPLTHVGVAYEIMRRDNGKLERLEADQFFFVQPGDIVTATQQSKVSALSGAITTAK